MRKLRYLNAILTVNAVLLGMLVWTQLVGGPLSAMHPAVASAQSSSQPVQAVPNAAAQRQQMIEALREMRRTNDATHKLLESGRVRVQVTNISELRQPAAEGNR
jgi:hypothetical protein